MNPNRRSSVSILFLIGILVLACSSVPAALTPQATFTPPATFTPSATITPTITLTPTPFYDLKQGSEISFPAGGFAFKRLIDFATFPHTAGISYFSTDDHLNVFMFAVTDGSPLTPKGLARRYVESMREDYEEFTALEPVEQIVNEVERATADFDAVDDDEPVHGRLTIFHPVQGGKLVYVLVVASGEQRWERQGEKVYNGITDSLTFFPLQINDVCPIQNNPGYGTSEVPIRIGGGLRESRQRITDYLDALLGPKGEAVAYYRIGVEESGGISLERYTIEYSHIQRDIFFDIYTSADLYVPTGLHCSAKLPSITK